MGGGSAPEVKLPDVGLVFGISLLIGNILMTIKSGSNFSENETLQEKIPLHPHQALCVLLSQFA